MAPKHSDNPLIFSPLHTRLPAAAVGARAAYMRHLLLYLSAHTHVEKDCARDDSRDSVSGDDEQPDAPQVGKEEVDVLEGHVLVGLPH